jgi:hypothetical protein
MDISKDLIKIEELIDGVKKKIVLVDKIDRQ